MRRIAAIIEARLNSKRLPNKVLKKINGTEIIKLIIERLKSSKYLDDIIVATTTNKQDDKLVNFLKKNNYKYYRGSEENLVKRVVKTGEKFKSNIIVRVTADNPLTDPDIIDYMIKYFLKKKKLDYLTNNYFADSKKRKIAVGLDISVFELNKLKTVLNSKKNKIYNEFTTLYFYTKGKKYFNIENIKLPSKYSIDNTFRLTIDTKKDFNFFKSLFKFVKNNNFKISTIKSILNKELNLKKINNNVIQFNPLND